MALSVVAGGILLIGLLLLWRDEGPDLPKDLPRRGTGPGPDGTQALRRVASPQARRAFVKQLKADAERFGVALERSVFAPFPLWLTEGRWKLPARGGRIETRELRLTTQVRRLRTPLGGLGVYQAPNLVLVIENRTDRYLAFRVLTVPSGRTACRPKATLPQPTLTLGPREALSRTECLSQGRGDWLTVRRIDVMAIPALAHHYLVKLKPVAVLGNARVVEGHTLPPKHTPCAGVPRQRIEQAARAGRATWADVIDFYARYSCDRWEYRVGYRRPGPAARQSKILRKKTL